MDKRQLLTFVLLAAAGAFLVMTFLNKQTPEPSAPSPTTAAASTAPARPAWPLGGKRFEQVQYTDAQGRTRTKPANMVRLGSLNPDAEKNPYKFQVEIDPRGAAIHTVKLCGIFDTVEHKRKKDKTEQELQAWSYPLLNPIERGAEPVLPFATRRVSIHGEQDISTFDFATAAGEVAAWEPGPVRTAEDGTQSVDLSLWIYRPGQVERGRHVLRVVKTYSLAPHSDSLHVSLRVENPLPRTQAVAVQQAGPSGMRREDFQQDQRAVCAGEFFSADGKVKVERKFDAKAVDKATDGQRHGMGDNRGAGTPAVWAAQYNKFFTCMMHPVPAGVSASAVNKDTPTEALVVKPTQYSFSFFREVVRESSESNTQAVVFQSDDIKVPAATVNEAGEVAPGEVAFAFDVYCGPKDRQTFNKTPLYDKLHYMGTIDLRSCICAFDVLAFLVIDTIEAGGKVLHNYGVIIILMVLVVRLLLHPLTKKGQVSMMKLSKLGPEMEKLRQKYGDDKEAFSREQMKFMKQQGASPFLGCLPMFLQMPIWIALWTGLQATPALRHAPLDPWWVNDLAAPDRLIDFGRTLFHMPMVGPIDALNLLPLLLAVFMFLQQKLTPMQSTAATGTSDEQRRQQKMMQVMMTGMFLLIFYNAPSGLTLYIMASTGGGVLESWVIRKHIREKEAAEAAVETRVEAPGRIGRAARPKKPKGDRPMRYQ